MKIGILVGMENTFPPALIEKINGMDAGITAEYVKIGSVKIGEPSGYRLIFDRISHEVPFYRSYLKNAVLNGAIVVNNPFWWSADEKFFGYSLATKLGIAVPKTVLLPQKAYKHGVTDASLRNLEFPLDWDGIIEDIGTPAILKPHDGGGWKDVYQIHSKEELWQAYDRTGTLAMVLQEFVNFSAYYRCYCVARKHVLVMPYDPANRRYLPREDHPIEPELEDRMVRDSILINEALGYDLNTVEFAVKDGLAYAIDFTNPAPDADIWSVTESYFNWITERVAEMLVDYAKNVEPTLRYHRWSRWINQDISQDLPVAVSEPGNATATPARPGRTRKAAGKKAASRSASANKTTRPSKAAKNVKKK